MVNHCEEKVKKKYKELGYGVLHRGCPDFLLFKYDNKNNVFYDIKFIEVKKDNSRLSKDQLLFIKVLKSLGIPVEVKHIKTT